MLVVYDWHVFFVAAIVARFDECTAKGQRNPPVRILSGGIGFGFIL